MGFNPFARLKAKGRPRPTSGRGETKLEAEYERHLLALLQEGLILSFQPQPLKLRLADKTYYSPDFLVVRPDQELEFHEVKAWWEDDARVKVKVAAEQFPMFHFVAVMLDRKAKTWREERF